MAVISFKMRCAECGSTEVALKDGLFSCNACNAVRRHAMPESDLMKISQIDLLGITQEEVDALRKKYRNLTITTWTDQSKSKK